MMKRFRHIIFGLVVAVLAVPAGIAASSPSQRAPELSYNSQNFYAQHQAQNQTHKQNQGKISASRAKSAAMDQYRGTKFINVQLINQSTYRVRLQQKNGRIVDVYVDAYTGRVKN